MSTSLSRRSSSATHPTRQQLEELDALLKRMLDLPVNRLDDEAEPEDSLPRESEPEPLRGPHRASVAHDASAAVNYQTVEEDEADLKPRVVLADSVAQGAELQAVESPAAQLEASAAQPADHEDWVPLTSTWKPSARTWKPLSEAWQQAKTGGPPASPPAAASKADRVEAAAPSHAQPPRDEAPPTVVEASLTAAPAESSAPLTPFRSEEGAFAAAAPPSAPPAIGAPGFLWPLVLFNSIFDAFLTPWGAPGRWLRGSAGRWLLAAVGVLCLTAAGALTVADWFGWTW